MNQLFNEKVVSGQPVSRDFAASSSGSGLPGNHSGTMVTTASGREYLIHHGSGFAAPGHNATVITDSSNMSSKWHPVGQSYSPNTTVGRLMRNSQDYNVFTHNCHDVTAGISNSSGTTTSPLGFSTGIKPRKETFIFYFMSTLFQLRPFSENTGIPPLNKLFSNANPS